MSEEVQILFVEDTPAEAVLVNHELRSAGLAFRLKRVETRDAFLRELMVNPPDVILSENGLPEFDGFAALAVAHEKCPQTPFIFVTGSLGEQKAVDMFRRGATDCVMKGNLAKLAPAIRRALEEARERGILKQKGLDLQDSEARYRRLVENSPDAIFVVMADDRISYLNPAAVALLGATAAKGLIGTPAQDIFRQDPWDSIDSRRRRRETVFFEQTLSRVDGSICQVEVSAVPTVFQGEPALQVVVHEIRERKDCARERR